MFFQSGGYFIEKVKPLSSTRRSYWKQVRKNIARYKYIYLILLPGLLFLIIFKYAPMYGIQLAFKDYNVADGITGSPWNGFFNFEYLFMEQEFWTALKNTFIISAMKILIGFPIPIILALALNEIIHTRFKKSLQVIFTFPHFLSWVVVSGLVFNLLSNSGAVNGLLEMLGFEKISFLTDVNTFRWLLVFTEAWKEAGWSSILWCSNNEMEWLWADEPVRIRGHHPRYKADYLKIFELILPRALQECDDATFFWPSSPSSGGAYDAPNCPDRGDQHYWEVWHSGKPFTEYRTHHFRFCSEYGFQSFPHSKTLATFTLPEDRNIFSEVMESHQKNGMANSKIFTYISDYFLYPKDLDSVAYISQVLQLKAIQYGVEHWRRNRGRCMGSLYWQLNDCWPVASWASIDYFGRWKALHYGARHFYAPVTISACEEEELSPHISYWLHNDTLEPQQRRLEVALLDTDFRVLWQTEGEFTASPLRAVNCIQADFSKWTQEPGCRNHLFARCRMYEGDNLLEERTTLFVKPKHFHYGTPVYHVTARETDDAFLFTVKSDRFCQYTELCFTDLDAVFSDNFFDITSPEGVTVSVSKADLPAGVTADRLLHALTVRSVADSYALPRE